MKLLIEIAVGIFVIVIVWNILSFIDRFNPPVSSEPTPFIPNENSTHYNEGYKD